MIQTTILPVDVDWPLLVAFLAHRHGKSRLARYVGMSPAAIEYYLTGETAVPKFESGLNFLACCGPLGPVKPFELLQAIGMKQVPVLPGEINWTEIPDAIKSTFQSGEVIEWQLTSTELECYKSAIRNYKNATAKPLWPTGAVLLNLLQDRMSAARYRKLSNLRPVIA